MDKFYYEKIIEKKCNNICSIDTTELYYMNYIDDCVEVVKSEYKKNINNDKEFILKDDQVFNSVYEYYKQNPSSSNKDLIEFIEEFFKINIILDIDEKLKDEPVLRKLEFLDILNKC